MKIQSNYKNVKYNDFVALVESYGFKCIRTRGSHNIFECENISEILNIQNDKGDAKPYQIKQFFVLVEKYNLKMEDKYNE